LCDENASRKWPFIRGAGDRASALYSRAGAPPWCPLWLRFLHSLLCLVFMPKNDSWVVVGRWKLSGEWNGVGG